MPDEDHAAATLFALAPVRTHIAAHELVHALKDDFARRALHPEHSLVAEHLGAVDVDDVAQKAVEQRGVEGALGLEHKALHVVIVVVVVMMVVPVFVPVAVTAAFVAVLTVFVVVVVMFVLFFLVQEVRLQVQAFVEVEAAQIQHFRNGRLSEIDHTLRGARVHVRKPVLQLVQLFLANQICLADEQAVGKADLPACLKTFIELVHGVARINEGDDGVEHVVLGHLVIQKEGLRHGTGVGEAGGFQNDALKVKLAARAPRRQVNQGGAQVLAYGTAHAAVVHLHDALACMDFIDRTASRISGASNVTDHNRKYPIINRCPYFVCHDLKLVDEWRDNTESAGSFHVLTPINSPIAVENARFRTEVPAGSSVLIPACFGRYVVKVSPGITTTVIRTSL